MSNSPHPHAWWQTGIIYEAYVRSFQDSNGDGVGDIQGLRDRLDYLQWLGIDILWINPVYKSPQREFGYDIADYTAVDPLFGTLEDFDGLIADAHKRNLKLVMDIAPNHTSSDHEWFLESKSSRDNPKRDWYIWKDPAPDGGPPNNWRSAFGGGSAWELDEATGQYYYHAFLKEQPDLNWRNGEVRAAFKECLRFWLDRGIDGFRIDVMWHHIKDEFYRDNPINPNYDEKKDPSNNVVMELFSASRPETIDLMVELRDVLKEYDGDRLMIGELYQSGADLNRYYGYPGRDAAQIPHNQQLILTPWEAAPVRAAVEQYLGALPVGRWPNWVMGNHDKPRLATRLGGLPQARVGLMMLLTLQGTPTLYYGDELGMTNVDIPKDQLQDPFEALDPGKGQGRDPQRTPMLWNGEENNAGFTTGKPWLPISSNWKEINVAQQIDDDHSMLKFTRALIELRRENAALTVGSYRGVLTDKDSPVMAYRREHEDGNFFIALNLCEDAAVIDLPYGYTDLETVLSTHGGADSPPVKNRLELKGHEGRILKQRRP